MAFNPVPVSDTPNTAGETVPMAVTSTPAAVASLPNRQVVTVVNVGDGDLAIIYDDALTFSDGVPIYVGRNRTWKIGPGISFWLVSGTTATSAIVEQLA